MRSIPLVDIVVRDPDGVPIVLVEVKNPVNLSVDVATAHRRNIVMHGPDALAPFFLLVSQDVGYLWNGRARLDPNAPPTLRFAMDRVIERYVPELPSTGRFGGSQLELVVFEWLFDLAGGRDTPLDEPERALAQTGLLAALRGARVDFPVRL